MSETTRSYETPVSRCLCCSQEFYSEVESFPGNVLDFLATCFSLESRTVSHRRQYSVCQFCTQRLIAVHRLKSLILDSLAKFNKVLAEDCRVPVLTNEDRIIDVSEASSNGVSKLENYMSDIEPSMVLQTSSKQDIDKIEQSKDLNPVEVTMVDANDNRLCYLSTDALLFNCDICVDLIRLEHLYTIEVPAKTTVHIKLEDINLAESKEMRYFRSPFTHRFKEPRNCQRLSNSDRLKNVPTETDGNINLKRYEDISTKSQIRLLEKLQQLKSCSMKTEPVDIFKCAKCMKPFKRKEDLIRHLQSLSECHEEVDCKFNLDRYKKNLRELLECEDYLSRRIKYKNEIETLKCTLCLKPLNCISEIKDHICHIKTYDYACFLCPETFKYVQQLTQHLKEHTGTGMYDCVMCSKPFKSQSELIRHMVSHTNVKKYTCAECSKSFNYKNSLIRHLMEHTGIGLLECVYCPKSFKSKTEFNNHVRAHNGVRKYTCDLCSKSFVNKFDLVGHLKWHSQVRDVECPFCPKAYKNKKHLKRHMLVHSGVKMHQCPECPNSFKTKCELTSHSITHVAERDFECPECSQRFKSKRSLVRHINRHTRIGYHRCQLCPSDFPTASALKWHMAVHTEERNFHCPLCSKSFWRKPLLARHVRIHTDAANFKCDLCPKAFARRCHMIQHLTTHSDARTFKCSTCTKSYKNKRELKNHEVTHTGARDFGCGQCLGTYRTKDDLRKHMKCHSGVRNYVCPLCSKTFFRSGDLTRHTRRHSNANTIKSYRCDTCSVNFTTKFLLNQHVDEGCRVESF